MIFGKPKVITDEKKIDEILDRYAGEILPSREKFKKKLMSGERLHLFVGADPTGPDLHLGHAINFIFLEHFRKLGHKTTILFGDFTAMLGDPTDKTAARVRLTKNQVEENIKTWKDQISKVVDFKSNNYPKVVRNSSWLGKINLEEAINLSANFTVQQMIERDMFQKRISDGKPIYFNEFFYPLLQGYDSVALDVDVEIGGNDQTFNMLAGRTLQERINKKEKIVVAIPLLHDPKTGKKMGKTEGNYIALSDTPDNMFGKVMSMSDEMMIQILQYTTRASMSKVKEIKKRFEDGENPKELKEEVAMEVVKTYHNEKLAKKAKENFAKLFSKGELPDDVQDIQVSLGSLLGDVLVENDFVKSKSEFNRFISSGAISVFNEEKISDPKFTLKETKVFKVGKKVFVKVVVK